MKISELLNEEVRSGTIKAVSGNDVTIDFGGKEIKTGKDSVLPGATPNTAVMKPTAPGELKPGMTITSDTTTSESHEDEEDCYGGDPTDDYINDIVDHEFERNSRTQASSKMGGSQNVLPKKHPEDLMKMLRIAGLR